MKKAFIGVFIIITCLFVLCACGETKEALIECDDFFVLLNGTQMIGATSNVEKPVYIYEVEGNAIEVKNGIAYGKELGVSKITISIKGYIGEKIVNVEVVEEGLRLSGPKEVVIEEQIELALYKFGLDEEEHIAWRSLNPEVASVFKGLVTGVSLGKAKIQAKSDVFTTEFEIEVIRPTATELIVEEGKETISLDNESKYELKYDVLPFYALKDITINCDNNLIKINEDNSLETKGIGKAKLTITSISNNKLVKEVNVNILEKQGPTIKKKSDYKEIIDVNYGDVSNLAQGLNIIDNADGDVSSSITCNTDLLRSYGEKEIELTVVDRAGNTATFKRTINVVWQYKTKFIGHRGSIYGVANTEEAFLTAARDMHYQALECDVHQTKDGVFVVNHDDDYLGMTIANYTFDELKDIVKTESTFGYPKSLGLASAKYTGKICTVQRYLEICKEYGCIAVVELKSSPGISSYSQDRMQALMDLIADCGMMDHLIILTSQRACLEWLRSNNYKDVKAQYLVNNLASEDTLNYCIKNHFDISSNTSGNYVTKEWVDRYHAAGLEVSVWTFSSYSNYDVVQKYIDMGVDYVTVDWHIMENLELK